MFHNCTFEPTFVSPVFPKQLRRANQSFFKKHITCSLTQQRSQMRVVNGILEVARDYDAVFLDQFGVIHDGQTPYPKALEAIRKLHESGVKIVILSNSSKRSEHSFAKLRKMGVHVDSIYGIVTSGGIALDVMRKFMSDKPTANVLHLNWTPTRGSISLSDHNITQIAPLSQSKGGFRMPNVEDIDFILAHGTDGITAEDGSVQQVPLNDLRALCRKIARERPDVPFYCANPDMVTVDGPQLRVMPGTLASDFEEAGGRYVHRLGKPLPVAYDTAVKLVGIEDKRRIIAIGDSVGHDILGAANAGIDSLYIAGGINAERFNIRPEDGFDETDVDWTWDTKVFDAVVEDEAPELGVRRPDYVSSFFRC